MRFSKKVAGRGNLTVPTDIRNALDIDDGDIVEFEVVGIVRKNQAAAQNPALDSTPEGTTTNQ